MIYLYILLGFITVLGGSSLVAYLRSYYVIGKKTAYKFVLSRRIIGDNVYDDWQSDSGGYQSFKKSVYEISLKSVDTPISSEILEFDKTVSNLIEKISKLNTKRDTLISELTKDMDISIDTSSFEARKTRAVLDIDEIDLELKELEHGLEELNARQVDRATDRVKIPEKITQKWYISILSNLSIYTNNMSANLLILFMLLVDYSIAVYFFVDVAKSSDSLMQVTYGWIFPFAVTVIMLIFLHMVMENVRSFSKRAWKNITSFDMLSILIPLGVASAIAIIILIWRLLGTRGEDISVVIREIVTWLLFVSFAGFVAHETTKPEREQSILNVVQPPFLTVLNIIGFVLLVPIWLIESVVREVKKIISGTSAPKSNKEAQLQKRINVLRSTKSDKTEALDVLEREKRAYSSQDIKRIQEECSAKIQIEINDIDKQIDNIQKEIEETKKKVAKLKKNRSDLHIGSDVGVMNSLFVRQRREQKIKRQEDVENKKEKLAEKREKMREMLKTRNGAKKNKK